jgi:hypothetical protein
MRLIKTFGLAVIAAAAVMAFVGVSSAMATELEEVVLCKSHGVTTGDKCPAGEDFPSGTVIHSELEAGTHATLGTSLGSVLCTESRALGETTSLLAHGTLTEAEFNNCTLGTTECTVEVQNLPYLVKGELNSGHNGYEVLLTSGGLGQPQAHVTCLGNILNCTYGAPNILFAAELKATDTVLSVSQALTGVGNPCGAANPVWTAKYLTRCLASGVLVGCWLKME